jgi:hypothetical protein
MDTTQERAMKIEADWIGALLASMGLVIALTGSAQLRPCARELLENVASALSAPDLGLRSAVEWQAPAG